MELEQLVRAAKAGDAHAWRLLTRRVEPRLRRFFASRCSGFEPDDLIQDTLVLVFKLLPSFELYSEAAFTGWTYRIAQNVAFKALRRCEQENRHAKGLDEADRSPPTKLSSYARRAERLASVLEEADQLPPSLKRAIANMLEGGDARDLAELAGITWGTARGMESRAVSRLRERLVPSTPTS